jgi:hypothetical protein
MRDLPDPPTTPTVNPCPDAAFARNRFNRTSVPRFHTAALSFPSLLISFLFSHANGSRTHPSSSHRVLLAVHIPQVWAKIFEVDVETSSGI